MKLDKIPSFGGGRVSVSVSSGVRVSITRVASSSTSSLIIPVVVIMISLGVTKMHIDDYHSVRRKDE